MNFSRWMGEVRGGSLGTGRRVRGRPKRKCEGGQPCDSAWWTDTEGGRPEKSFEATLVPQQHSSSVEAKDKPTSWRSSMEVGKMVEIYHQNAYIVTDSKCDRHHQMGKIVFLVFLDDWLVARAASIHRGSRHLLVYAGLGRRWAVSVGSSGTHQQRDSHISVRQGRGGIALSTMGWVVGTGRAGVLRGGTLGSRSVSTHPLK